MNSPVLPPATLPSVAPTPPAQPRLLAESVGERLRDMIVQGELAPGVDLNERVLCEQLGISRTPLREALKALASEGLVELAANRGARVAPVTMEKVREVFRVMGALEALSRATSTCANRALAESIQVPTASLSSRARGRRADMVCCRR